MPFVSANYASNADAPVGDWVCTLSSSLGPFTEHPVDSQRHDQWITGAGKAVGPRVIRWNGTGVSNRGDGFYVVE
jgi:hypothetical protein